MFNIRYYTSHTQIKWHEMAWHRNNTSHQSPRIAKNFELKPVYCVNARHTCS